MENKDCVVVYGLIEPYSRNIVYINTALCSYCIKDEDYIEHSIDVMKTDNNKYWRDLYNMNKVRLYDYKESINVIILDKWTKEDIPYDNFAKERLNYWRNLFKPRYNIGEYEEDTYSEADKYIKNGWLKYNGKEWVFTSPELENMWYGVDEDSE